MPANSGNQSQTPPFLTKTYDMLDQGDENTKSIISWSDNGQSFIIWKPIEFQKDLLASHFKHSNLSSFVRQLNTYGFRKIDPDKYEFQNENFIRGRKDLLQSIHRRKPPKEKEHDVFGTDNNAVQQYNNGLSNMVQVDPSQMQQLQNLPSIVENLQRDKNVLMVEIIRLRQQQQAQQAEMIGLQKHLNKSDRLIQKVILAFRQLIQYPEVVNKLIDFNTRKKRKLSEEQEQAQQQPQNNQQLIQYGVQNELLDIFNQMLSEQQTSDQVHVASPSQSQQANGGQDKQNAHKVNIASPSQSQQEANGYQGNQQGQQGQKNNGQNVVITEVPLNFGGNNSRKSQEVGQQDPQSSNSDQQSSQFKNIINNSRDVSSNNYNNYGSFNSDNSSTGPGQPGKANILPQSSFELAQMQNQQNQQNQSNQNNNNNNQYINNYTPNYDQGSVDILNEALDGLLDDETMGRLTSLDLAGGMNQDMNQFNNDLGEDQQYWSGNNEDIQS